MPGLTLYDLSIPIMVRNLQNLSAILTKGAEYASSKGVPLDGLIKARIYSDMGDLAFQIQRVSDCAKGLAVRLCDHPPVSMADNETTFEELQERISKTIDLLNEVKPDSTNGKEDQIIELKTGAGDVKFTGKEYTQHFALPNFFFHVVTAYDILRAQGVPVGKADFLALKPNK